MPMGPPDENWTLPSWAAKSSNEEIQDQKANTQIESQTDAEDLTPEETPAAAAEFSMLRGSLVESAHLPFILLEF